MVIQMNGELKIKAKQIIDEAYNSGKNDAKREISLSGEYERAYQRGLDDAWEAARKIALSVEDGGLPNETAYVIFGMRFYQVFRDMSVTEVIEKIRKYEQYEVETTEVDDEIRVGDEVYLLDERYPRVVTCITRTKSKNLVAIQLTQSGKWIEDYVTELHKTGRHFDQIQEVLKALEEVEE